MNSLISFCIVGGAGFLTDSAVLLALTELGGVSPLLARVFSFLVAVIVTWIGNTRYSFRNAGQKLTLESFMGYLAYQSLGMALNLLIYTTLVLVGPTSMGKPIVALAIASSVAMVFNYLVLKKIHYSGKVGDGGIFSGFINNLPSLVFFSIIGGIVSIALGQDCNWDLRNYHIYNAWALLDWRYGKDFFAAGIQSFFNPLLDLPYFILSTYFVKSHYRLLAFLAGLPYGVLIFLVFKTYSALLRFVENSAQKKMLIFLSVLLSVSGAGLLPQVGTTFNEVQTGVLVIASLYFMLKAFDQPKYEYFIVSGAFIGLAVGLKLNAAIYGPGMLLGAILCSRKSGQPARKIALFAIAALFMFLLVWGWWAVLLVHQTGNPVFPMFNQIFRSPLSAPVPGTDNRFKPTGLAESIFYPFFWLTPRAGVVAEPVFADPRFAFACLSILLLVFLMIFDFKKIKRLESRDAFLLAFLVVSYCVWLGLFSIIRYAVSMEVLTAAAVLLLIKIMVKRERYIKTALPALLCCCCVSILATTYPRWGRSDYGSEVAAIQSSEKKIEDGTLVIFLGNPMAYIAPSLAKQAKNISFVGIDGYVTQEGKSGAVPHGFVIGNRNFGIKKIIQDKIDNHPGKIIVIMNNDGPELRIFLDAFGCSVDLPNSWILKTKIESLTCAPVYRSGIKKPAP